MANTLNMDLELPVVGTTAGPTYASLLNTALETVDAHDHTSGKGVQIPTSGLNINATLQFNSNAATELTHIALESQGSAPSDTKSVYVDTSNDLYYKNGAGTTIQITNGGALAAVGSGVMTYSEITSTPYSVTTGDAQKVLGVDTSVARTLNLPAASNEMFVIIKDTDGQAATYNITVTPSGSDTIDGAASLTLSENYGARALMSDGVSKWFIV